MRSILLVTFVVLAGCATGLKPPDTLAESIRSFNDGIRWERFSVAAGRIPAAERSQFVDDMDHRSEDLKITDYEIIRVDSKGSKAAKVHIKLSWYRTPQNTLHETHAIQTWERQGKIWMMVSEARLRGTEMPGLPEAPEQESRAP